MAFGLRTGEEQAALVGVFAGWLNSLDAPVQILLQARPVDLSDPADRISDTAGHLAIQRSSRRPTSTPTSSPNSAPPAIC